MTRAQIRSPRFTEHRHRAQDAQGGGEGYLAYGHPAPAHAQIRARTAHERSHTWPIAVKVCQSPCPVMPSCARTSTLQHCCLGCRELQPGPPVKKWARILEQLK
eukprot:2935992-Prymnesium_polylepis.1